MLVHAKKLIYTDKIQYTADGRMEVAGGARGGRQVWRWQLFKASTMMQVIGLKSCRETFNGDMQACQIFRHN
jgi:hypothetical protein